MEKIKEKIKLITIKQWHITIIILGIIFISLGAFHSNIWFDESYSVGMARHTFAEIWAIGGNDVHPVLYYWGLRLIYLLTGGSIVNYRIFSIIPIAIMIIMGYTHIRKDFGEKTGLIFSFLSAFLPTMALYASEIRMYAWAMLTVTILAIYAYRLAKQDNIKDWIIFGLSSLVSIYLHYYGLMAAGLINVALLIYLIIQKRKTGLIFIISFGIIQAIAYLPWLVSLLSQMSNVSKGFWIETKFPKAYMEIISTQLVGYIPTGDDYSKLIAPTVLSIELYAYLIYKIYRNIKDKKDIKPCLWAGGIYLAVIIAAIIITKILNSEILYYRYLFVITGLYIFVLSFIFGKEENKISVVTILVVIGALGIYNNIDMIKSNYSTTNIEPINYMKENIQSEDTIVFKDIGAGSVAAVHFEENQVYFYNDENWGVEEAYKAFGPNYETVINDEFIKNCSNRIWVVDHAWGDTVEKVFEKTNYKVVSQETFFTQYHDYHYKITLLEN